MMKNTDTSWKGNCYKNAIDLMIDPSKVNFNLDSNQLVVVHGIVSGNGPLKGHKIAHAWLEDNNYCYDQDAISNNIIQLEKRFYYITGEIQIKDTRRYKKEDVIENLLTYSHTGPWDRNIMKHAEKEFNVNQ